MKKIKLMADYQCYPLWHFSANEYGDINPATLPIPTALQEQLLDWAKTYDSILNWDDPASSAFFSEKAENDFKIEGYRLGEALKSELGCDYEVDVFVG